jgi:hypothetical protein
MAPGLPYLEGFKVFKNKKEPLSQMASYENVEFALSSQTRVTHIAFTTRTEG